ncbi:hypothetical protein [Alistipes sp.]|uniref:hypothetical protein n=1 Tax=Alistipes sp. TaxID=1872444 RepID=UPI003AEF24DD
MKKFFFILLFAAVSGPALAQDVITKRNAEEIEARVLRVSDTEIEYLRWDNPDGPVYVIPTRDVFFIRYQNGSKDVITTWNAPRRGHLGIADNFQMKYQGEIALGYGLGVGNVSDFLNTDRIVFETVHGLRINPYLFTGIGVGVDYFYSDMEISNSWIDDLYDGALVLAPFWNIKGYCPVGRNVSAFLALDLGAAIGVSGYADGTEFYASIGPGICLTSKKSRLRGDFGIRFQHMGTGTNAILFRIGFGF